MEIENKWKRGHGWYKQKFLNYLIEWIVIKSEFFDERSVDKSVTVKRSYSVVTQDDGLEAGQASEATSFEVSQTIVAQVKLFEAYDVNEAVLSQLLDRVPAEVELLQGLDGGHGSADDRRVRNSVASEADLAKLLLEVVCEN